LHPYLREAQLGVFFQIEKKSIYLNNLFMNHYETVFILNPVLSEDQIKETVKKFEDLLVSNGAKMISKEDWGLKKLAYPIQHKKSGFYHLFEFTVPGEVVNTLELAFRRDERVMRYLTVKLDKHAIAWAEKRRTRNKEKA
jgi:small subunit ribosomal protein S6